MIIVGVAGIVRLGFQMWNPFGAAHQHAAQEKLIHSWGKHDKAASCQPVRRVAQDRIFAIVRIPALGRDWRFTLIQGSTKHDLSTGLGHVRGTAMPGGPNFAVAGHVVTTGNPFEHLSDLRSGDRVFIRTEHCRYAYRISGIPRRVLATDVAVLGQPAHGHRLTLITCWLQWPAKYRVVAFGTLVRKAGS